MYMHIKVYIYIKELDPKLVNDEVIIVCTYVHSNTSIQTQEYSSVTKLRVKNCLYHFRSLICIDLHPNVILYIHMA
jgi:hypothetical protein